MPSSSGASRPSGTGTVVVVVSAAVASVPASSGAATDRSGAILDSLIAASIWAVTALRCSSLAPSASFALTASERPDMTLLAARAVPTAASAPNCVARPAASAATPGAPRAVENAPETGMLSPTDRPTPASRSASSSPLRRASNTLLSSVLPAPCPASSPISPAVLAANIRRRSTASSARADAAPEAAGRARGLSSSPVLARIRP